MKEQYNKLVNESNKKRSNIYYQLNQLTDFTGLSLRMLKYKMIKIKEKYKGVTSLLEKNGKKWQIHYSIINEFMPINKRQSNIISYDNWKCFVTWNSQLNYDVEYHYELIKEIKNQLPHNKIKYTIELDNRGYKHVHFISDTSTQLTKKIVESTINKYFSWYEIIYQIVDINNKFSSKQYLAKAPLKSGIL